MNATETLAALITLDGVWRGDGEGYLPNGDTFAYREQARIMRLRSPTLSLMSGALSATSLAASARHTLARGLSLRF